MTTPTPPLSERDRRTLTERLSNAINWLRDGKSTGPGVGLGDFLMLHAHLTAPSSPATEPVTSCDDDDSPWLVCKTCAAAGQCARRAAIAAPSPAVDAGVEREAALRGRAGSVSMETHNKIAFRLGWLECGEPINTAEFVADVRTLLAASPPPGSQQEAETVEVTDGTWHFEVYELHGEDEMLVASGSGPDRATAITEGSRYAYQYAQDGPVKVLLVQRFEHSLFDIFARAADRNRAESAEG